MFLVAARTVSEFWPVDLSSAAGGSKPVCRQQQEGYGSIRVGAVSGRYGSAAGVQQQLQ